MRDRLVLVPSVEVNCDPVIEGEGIPREPPEDPP
jgi:hypothetical protein